MSRLGYSAEQQAALRAGKVVTTDLTRTRDDQLIAAAAMRLPVGIAQLWDGVRASRALHADPGILAFGELGSGKDEAAWAALTFDEGERDEAKRLLRFRGGSDFNLSAAEIDTLQQALKGQSAEAEDLPETVSAAYRKLLIGRYDAYRTEGLSGIAPYQQGGVTLSPAKELAAVVAQSEDFLTTFFPDFWRAFSGFPEGQSAEIHNKFHWIKRKVEGRPAFALVHDAVTGGEDHVLMTRREYFVGHTYDSLQVVALALPVDDGTAVFYVNSAFTDRITGFLSGVARSVGQDRMKDDLTDYFQALRQKRSN